MTTTPGRRLHAALLAHGIVTDEWDGMHPSQHRDYEAASWTYWENDMRPSAAPPPFRPSVLHKRPSGFMRARGCLLPTHVDPGPVPDEGDALAVRVWWHSDDLNNLFADLGRLTAEVAALRRDRDADLHAMGEVGDRLARVESRLEALAGEVESLCAARSDHHDRLARCEGRDGEIIERLRALEHLRAADQREVNAAVRRVADLEARVGALDGSVAPNEQDGVHVERWCPHCGETLRLDAVLRAKGKGGDIASRLAALEARAIDGGDPLRRTG